METEDVSNDQSLRSCTKTMIRMLSVLKCPRNVQKFLAQLG